jgi:hypothetical protein
MPRHEWRGSELRFEMPGGSWGAWTKLKGDPGGSALSLPVVAAADQSATSRSMSAASFPVPPVSLAQFYTTTVNG